MADSHGVGACAIRWNCWEVVPGQLAEPFVLHREVASLARPA
ncbi:hypothetical protein ACE0DR_28600 [Azotobacter sp. CWF10]